MKKILLFLVIETLILLVGCLFAWIGGYNFDHRGFEVAYGFGCLLFLSSIVTVIALFTL